jgi:hypothetical protein
MIQRRTFFLSGLAAKAVKLLAILALVTTSACYARASPYYYGPTHYSRGGYYRSPPARHYYYAPERRERRWHGPERHEHRWHERHEGSRHHHHHHDR